MKAVSMPASVPAGAALPAPRVTYISWAESCSRSDHTARELGGTSHMVYLGNLGSHPATIVFKYIGQWRSTARILAAETPDVVFVMTPPLFAAFPAFWYAFIRGKRVALDAHTAAFLHPRWRRLQWLQRVLCRRAVTTIVHNEHLAELVTSYGAHATVVQDVPVIFADTEPFPRPDAFTVAIVCSFNYDEPVEAMLDAAAMLPDVRFFMTGNPKHLAKNLADRLPGNVTLTGFLSTAAYGGLLNAADAVMTLTTRDHTMLRGAYEAIYQSTPVIVSDWPLLRKAFPEGAEHAANDAASIAAAVARMQANLALYRAGAAKVRETKQARWRLTQQAILDRLM